jgi:hypothetical protein
MAGETCILCVRKSIPSMRLCHNHDIASNEIREAYATWQEGYGELSWRNYLKKVLSIPETGQWAQEVAKQELSDLDGIEGNSR